MLSMWLPFELVIVQQLLLALVAKSTKIMLAKYMPNLLHFVGFKHAWSHLQLLSLTLQNDAIAQLSHFHQDEHYGCRWGVVVQLLNSECIPSDYE